MKVIIPPIYERDNVDITLDEHDIFGRKKFIENLTALFRSTSDGLVITIDSKWGDGKTTLIKQWEQHLDSNELFVPIYYDAFKNDFTEEPFLSIAVEIHEALKKELDKNGRDKKNEDQLENLKKNTIAISEGLLKTLTRSAATSLAMGVIPSQNISNQVGKLVEQLLFGTLKYDAEEKFKAHITLKKNIQEYQDQLKEILTDESGAANKKIVFFVDELDRCRPSFAVEVIEKIKHLFSIDSVFFVLAINKEQLAQIIKHNYGIHADDAENYLQKFVHIVYKDSIHLTVRPWLVGC